MFDVNVFRPIIRNGKKFHAVVFNSTIFRLLVHLAKTLKSFKGIKSMGHFCCKICTSNVDLLKCLRT